MLAVSLFGDPTAAAYNLLWDEKEYCFVLLATFKDKGIQGPRTVQIELKLLFT